MISSLKKKIEESKAKAKLESRWLEVMVNTNTFNQAKDTFSLFDVEKAHYGYKGGVYIVAGLNYSKLEELIEYIEDYIGCTVVLNKKKRTNIASIKFVFDVSTISYTPVKVKPWECYIGNDIDGEPIIVSMIEAPHILLSGSTRGGKSKLLDCLNTTLINCCSEFELELYLIQVAKSDFIIFEDAKQVRGFAENLDQAEIILNHIIKKMNDRNELIKPMRKKAKGSNYMDYNKLNPHNKQSTVYVELDEMASLTDTKGDSGNVKKQKEKIVANLEKIAQYGASLGIFLVSCLQRPTADKLPPFVKSQSTLKISFRQNNSKSSEVAVDDPQAALKLEQREAVYSISGEYKYLKVPTIYDQTVYQYIKSNLQPNHRNLFTDIQKLKMSNIPDEAPQKHNGREKISEEESKKDKKLKQSTEPKTTPMNFDKVDPVKAKELEANIKAIPGFVPYQPIDLDVVVVDKTTIPTNTQKPLRKGKEKV